MNMKAAQVDVVEPLKNEAYKGATFFGKPHHSVRLEGGCEMDYVQI